MAEILLFFGVMVLTFYTVFYQQNPLQILAAVRQIRISYAVAAFLLGILFICLEGSMIWYLLHGLGSSCRISASYAVGLLQASIQPKYHMNILLRDHISDHECKQSRSRYKANINICLLFTEICISCLQVCILLL